MGETPNRFPHLKVHKSFDHLVQKIILFDGPGGKEADGHFHVFITVERCRELKISNVEAHVSCIRCAEHTVPIEFHCCHIGCVCGEFARIID